MPVLALGGGYMPAFGGNITMPSIIYLMKILAQNVQSIIVPNSGHWYQEAQPVVLLKLLNNFYSSNLTETSKREIPQSAAQVRYQNFLQK
jgi:hypothetical protein